MIGLTYIRNLFDMSMQDVADELGISKQTVSKWENGQRPIPKKRLEQLSEMFDVAAKYFDKELSMIEESEIEYNKLKKKLDYREDEEGNEVITIRNDEDMKLSVELELMEEEIESLKVIKKITKIMTFNDLNEDASYTEQVSNIISSFDLLSDTISSKKSNLNIVSDLIYSMALYYGATERDKEQLENESSKEPLWMQELFYTNEGFINKVFDLIKEEEKRLEKAEQDKERFFSNK